ncbi:MAG: UDP-N-acetylglucosamine 1-carboxyvinyltransferase, partial [Lactococcus lactis]|nr:UDP-N-acetylglucosamine 1-carboxyvinyltransferase [Lactococcus lactis]
KRVNHIPELNRMGAKIRVESDMILIGGNRKLTGAEVQATDLRAGASLVVAGLMAEGTTKITGIFNILRGYANIVDKLTVMGADIKIVKEK